MNEKLLAHLFFEQIRQERAQFMSQVMVIPPSRFIEVIERRSEWTPEELPLLNLQWNADALAMWEASLKQTTHPPEPTLQAVVAKLAERVEKVIGYLGPGDISIFEWLNGRLAGAFGDEIGDAEQVAGMLRRARPTFSAYRHNGSSITLKPSFISRVNIVVPLVSEAKADETVALGVCGGSLQLDPTRLPDSPTLYWLGEGTDYSGGNAEVVIGWAADIADDADDFALRDACCYYELWQRYADRGTEDWADVVGRMSLTNEEADLIFKYHLLRDIIAPMENGLKAIEDQILRDDIAPRKDGLMVNQDQREQFLTMHPVLKELPALARLRLIEDVRTPLVASLSRL